jgi:hypothetical protein
MGPREIARSKEVNTNSPQRKAGTAAPKKWELESYKYTKEQKDDNRSSHGDPRLEFAVQIHGQHQDDFTSSDDDGDHGYGSPGFGIGAMSDLSASASSTSDQGTLAGGGCFSRPPTEVQRQPRETRQPQPWSYFDRFSETDKTGQRRLKSLRKYRTS